MQTKVLVGMSEDLKQRLFKAAHARCLTMSEYVRFAVAEQIRRDTEEPPKTP